LSATTGISGWAGIDNGSALLFRGFRRYLRWYECEGERAQFGESAYSAETIGGGFDIAAFVYRCVYRHLFFAQPYTALKDAYFTLFDIKSPDAFLSSAARIQNEEAARQLIGLFFTAVETGDEIALRYAARAASHAADCIIAVSDALHLKPTVPVALSGSIMTAVAPPAYRA
jgi:N-acetylglucosamine kinase-like BadF-type ATPase